MPTQLRTADRYYRFSQRLAQRATQRARQAPTTQAAAAVVVQHQAAQAAEVPSVSTAMLTEQRLQAPAATPLLPVAFTTDPSDVEAMLAELQQDVEWEFERLVASLVQDAGRAAQVVDATTRPDVWHVRHLNLPSCSRCAVLGGRIYRYSQGFQRHPNCDCVMIPTTVAAPDLTYDPEQLARDGLIRGLSKADVKALDDGADFNRLVNFKTAGLRPAGSSLTRAGRPTPAAIYRAAGDDRGAALAALTRHGYIR